MRGQVTGRELDDVGENVLSYAEVKALATGNPLVIEQAGVQADLAKLERLARAHHGDQRRLQQAVASDRREAARYRTLEAAYTAAIARRVDTSGDRFHMEIDAVRHTARVEAGEALIQRARAVIYDAARHRGDTREVPARTVGRLAGFVLQLDGYKLGQTLGARITTVLDDTNTIGLRLTPDDLQAKKPDALVGQLEGPIRKLDDKLAAARRMATDFETQASEATTRLGQPFPDQDRLDHLRRRYQQILDELNTEADPVGPAPAVRRETSSAADHLDRLAGPAAHRPPEIEQG